MAPSTAGRAEDRNSGDDAHMDGDRGGGRGRGARAVAAEELGGWR